MAVLGWQVVRGLVKGARAGEAVVFKILGFVKVWVRFGSTDRLEGGLGVGSKRNRASPQIDGLQHGKSPQTY